MVDVSQTEKKSTREESKNKENKYGIACFIFGLISLIPFVGIITGIIGIVLYYLQKKVYNNGLNLAGLILSILGLVESISFIFFYVSVRYVMMSLI